MELRELWQIVRRRWQIPLVLTVLVALLSAIQLRPWQEQAPTYRATLRLLVGVMPAVEADITAYDPRYYAWLTSEYLVDDFTEVVRSELFARNVSARLAGLNLQIPAGAIQGSAATGKLHRILTLTFGWHDQEELDAIAAAVVAELSENATLYFEQLGTDGAGITLLDGPTIGAVGPDLRRRLEWPLRVLLAALAGIGLSFLLHYLDTSIRTRQELEEMGFHILGEIPKG